VARAVRDWIGAVVGAKTSYIEPGSPWENGFIESFNARLRAELLNGEIFYSLAEARDHVLERGVAAGTVTVGRRLGRDACQAAMSGNRRAMSLHQSR
jgi:transposase InsO family protein